MPLNTDLINDNSCIFLVVKFSNIFFITVSQKGNLDLIVQRFCEYKGWVPDILNEVRSIQLLKKFLNEEHDPFLLVLDDVWSGSDFFLDKLNQFKTSNFKILVTSRSEFPRFGRSYHLRMLDDENAMKLFRHTASLKDRSSPIPENIVKNVRFLHFFRGIYLASYFIDINLVLCSYALVFWSLSSSKNITSSLVV